MLSSTLKEYLGDFAALLYPDLCAACGHNLYKGEQVLCLQCLHQLPYTQFHEHPDNPLERILWGRATLKAATALLFFKKSTRVQQVLHQLKYNGNQEVGIKMGQLMAKQLLLSTRFATLDAIVPVPLHKDKEAKRGYNQSACFAEGIAQILQIPLLTENLVRVSANSSQTRKNRYERFLNTEDLFQVQRPDELNGRHLLLVDDVVTTGATLEACCEALSKHPASISIATIAYAKQ